jgi:hypothetical protein
MKYVLLIAFIVAVAAASPAAADDPRLHARIPADATWVSSMGLSESWGHWHIPWHRHSPHRHNPHRHNPHRHSPHGHQPACASGRGWASCSKCSKGKYSPGGFASCKNCQANKYADQTGKGSCKSCSAGKHTNGQTKRTAASQCGCAKGQRTSGSGCAACQRGKFQTSAHHNKAACSDCPNHSFNPDLGRTTNCYACPGITKTNGNGKTSLADCQCGAGQRRFRSVNDPNKTCKECNAGQYQTSSFHAKDSCDQCGENKYQANTGQPTCSSCPAGRTTNGGLGKTALSHCRCASGQFWQPEQLSVAGAPNSGWEHLTDVAGSFTWYWYGPIWNGSTRRRRNHSQYVAPECKSCAAGRYQSNEYHLQQVGSACSACPPGHVSGAGAKSCTRCGAGTEPSSDGSKCEACASGKWSPGGLENCKAPDPCSGTEYTFVEFTPTSPRVCKAHQTCKSWQWEIVAAVPWSQTHGGSDRECEECPVGSWCNGTSKTQCLAGTHSQKGTARTSCKSCGLDNMWSEAGAAFECLKCNAGEFTSLGSSATRQKCSDCPFGNHCDGTSVKSACGNDKKYNAAGAPHACKTCPSGSYTSGGDQNTRETCDVCPAGSKCDGGSTITACPKGTFSSEGKSQCSPCGKDNFFSWREGTPHACHECPIDFFTQGGSSSMRTECDRCPVGNECNGSSVTTKCGTGSVSAFGASKCEPCASGTYAAGTDWGACRPCPADTYSAFAGADRCTAQPVCQMPDPQVDNSAGQFVEAEGSPSKPRVCTDLTVADEFQWIEDVATPTTQRQVTNCPFAFKATDDHKACYAYMCANVECAHVEHKCTDYNQAQPSAPINWANTFSADASSSLKVALAGNQHADALSADGTSIDPSKISLELGTGTGTVRGRCHQGKSFKTTVTHHARGDATCAAGHWCGQGIVTGDTTKCECAPIALMPTHQDSGAAKTKDDEAERNPIEAAKARADAAANAAKAAALKADGGDARTTPAPTITTTTTTTTTAPPCICANVYQPVVCASNSKTYGNQCEASCENAVGCAEPTIPNPITAPQPQCACTKMHKPVVCSNGATYSNSCEAKCERAVGCSEV